MGKLIGLFVFSLLLLFSGAYLNTNPVWLQKYKKPVQGSSLFSPQDSTTPVNLPSTKPISPTPMANWQKYTASDQVFTLQYPSDWQLKTDVPGCGPVWFPPTTTKIWLTICGPYAEPDKNADSFAQQAVTSDVTLINRTQIQLQNFTATKQSLQVDGGTATQVYIPTNQGVLAIYFTNLDPGSASAATDIFEQILTTLKIN